MLGHKSKTQICKPRAQYAKRNCAFKLCGITINAKNASFHKNVKLFLNKKVKILVYLYLQDSDPDVQITRKWT
jgi:hypothetical protein